MAVSLSASLNVKNSVPLPGGRCKYTGQSVLKHYCCIEDVQIRSSPKNARKVSLSASLKTLNTKSSVPLSGGRCKYTGQSVRALPIRILTVGKKRSRGVQVIVDEYIEKLKHYCRIEDVQIRSNPKNASDVMAQVEHEDMAFMYLIKSDDWVVMLDERGLDIRSEQMAELVGDAGNTGASSLLFCIGGPYGHGRQLRQRANVSIKLSSLVLNHQIALVVLVEQLYRAWTILKGQKYHH